MLSDERYTCYRTPQKPVGSRPVSASLTSLEFVCNDIHLFYTACLSHYYHARPLSLLAIQTAGMVQTPEWLKIQIILTNITDALSTTSASHVHLASPAQATRFPRIMTANIVLGCCLALWTTRISSVGTQVHGWTDLSVLILYCFHLL